MKNFKKVLVTLVAAMLLVAVSVMGTLAYLTSTDEVKNTFTVGDIQITLDEAKVNTAGEPLNAAGEVIADYMQAPRVDNNEYHLLPNRTYTKDPTIHIDNNSEDAYLRLVVTVNKADAADALLGSSFNPPEGQTVPPVLTGFNKNLWTVVDNTLTNVTDAEGKVVDKVRTYVLEYTLDGKEGVINGNTADIVLFTEVVVPADLTNEQIASLAGLEMNIVAYAVQTEGFDGENEGGSDAAFAAAFADETVAAQKK